MGNDEYTQSRLGPAYAAEASKIFVAHQRALERLHNALKLLASSIAPFESEEAVKILLDGAEEQLRSLANLE